MEQLSILNENLSIIVKWPNILSKLYKKKNTEEKILSEEKKMIFTT